jgi:hypothetical protein
VLTGPNAVLLAGSGRRYHGRPGLGCTEQGGNGRAAGGQGGEPGHLVTNAAGTAQRKLSVWPDLDSQVSVRGGTSSTRMAASGTADRRKGRVAVRRRCPSQPGAPLSGRGSAAAAPDALTEHVGDMSAEPASLPVKCGLEAGGGAPCQVRSRRSDGVHRKDHEETARALSSGFARLDGALEPGGAFESLDPVQVRRPLAVVTGGMAEWFHDHNRVFNSEAFLRECGMLDDVKTLNLHRPQRERFAPLDYADVKPGDCLFYITSGARQCAGIVSSITDLAVTLDHGWDLDENIEVYGKTKLRRSNWSRHDVLLWIPATYQTTGRTPPRRPEQQRRRLRHLPSRHPGHQRLRDHRCDRRTGSHGTPTVTTAPRNQTQYRATPPPSPRYAVPWSSFQQRAGRLSSCGRGPQIVAQRRCRLPGAPMTRARRTPTRTLADRAKSTDAVRHRLLPSPPNRQFGRGIPNTL